MLRFMQGDLLKCQAEALVNTVNTEGVMGKGIALQFRQAFPDMHKAYLQACRAGCVQPGRMFICTLSAIEGLKYIINFPTKRSWRSKSRMEDIESGLRALVDDVRRLEIRSVAVPPLGCGLGGLSWPEVRQRMQTAFEQLPEVEWFIYEPASRPADAGARQTPRPKMTKGRAILIELIRRYLVPGFCYGISLLEIQKLMYFMVKAGEEMPQVVFEKGHYGPYADVLRHLLERIDGHFIEGYSAGGNKPDSPITLLPEAAREAEALLKDCEETAGRFRRVSELIVGFETSFGMELLSTVHWVVTRECEEHARGPTEAFEKIRAWNTRKAALMSREHVAAAWQRLASRGWFGKV